MLPGTLQPISKQLSIKHPCDIENVYEGTENSCDAMCVMLSCGSARRTAAAGSTNINEIIWTL